MPDAASAISAVTAAAAVVTLLAYFYSLRRTDQTAAREEALALAETRRQMVKELERRLSALEARERSARTFYERRIVALEEELAQARSEAREPAYEFDRLDPLALVDSLSRLDAHLEELAARIDLTLARVGELHPEVRRPPR